MPERDVPNGNGANAAHDTNPAAVFGEALHEAEDFVKRQWRDNPLQVAAIAAGIGLLIGILLGRRA